MHWKAGINLDFLPPGKKISVTGSVTDKNCSEQSLPEMSITYIKIQNSLQFQNFISYLLTR